MGNILLCVCVGIFFFLGGGLVSAKRAWLGACPQLGLDCLVFGRLVCFVWGLFFLFLFFVGNFSFGGGGS